MTELVSIPGHWDFDYTYFAGEAASRFFAELRNTRVMGATCPDCRRVLVPARSFCDACFQRTTDWVQVGPEGILETFTIITAAFPGLPVIGLFGGGGLVVPVVSSITTGWELDPM